jgi:hypothetical protein
MRYLTHALCKALEEKEEINVKRLMEQVSRDSLIHAVQREMKVRKGSLIELHHADSARSMAQ